MQHSYRSTKEGHTLLVNAFKEVSEHPATYDFYCLECEETVSVPVIDIRCQ